MAEYLLHRKDSLVLTAIEVIDELGIQGSTTREIARRQGISEATLFRHYNTKNSLMHAVLDYYSKFDSDIFSSIKIKVLSPIESIKYFIKAYVEYYENYPQITALDQEYEILIHEPELAVKVKSIYNDRFEFLKKLLIEAQNAGEFPQNINAENLTDIIIGLCRGICLRWRMSGYGFSLKEHTLSALNMVIDALNI